MLLDEGLFDNNNNADNDMVVVRYKDPNKEDTIYYKDYDEACELYDSLELTDDIQSIARLNGTTYETMEIKYNDDNLVDAIKGKILEFPNGDYMYVDYHNGSLIAGHATNAGMFSEIEIEYDWDKSVDDNLQDLYDIIIEQHPELEETDKVNESIKDETKAIRQEMTKVGLPPKKKFKETQKFLSLLKQKREQSTIKESDEGELSNKTFTKEDQLKQLESTLNTLKSHIETLEKEIADGEYEGKEDKANKLLKGFKDTLKLGNDKISKLKSVNEGWRDLAKNDKESFENILTQDEFDKLVSSGNTEHLNKRDYSIAVYPKKGMFIRKIVDGKARPWASSVHSDDIKKGYDHVKGLYNVSESLDVNPKEEIKSSLLGMKVNDELKLPIKSGISNGFDMFHIKRLDENRWSVWYSNNNNDIADLNEHVTIDFATDLVFDITGGTLEYNEKDAKDWENAFDIANPQDVANELGRPVKLNGVIFYPKTNESLKEDIALVTTDAAQEIKDVIEKVPAAPTQGPDIGIATVISSLIKDEWDAIDGYNSAIVSAEMEGMHDIAEIFTEIANDEHKHVGSLEKALSIISPQADHSIPEGVHEAQEIIDKSNLNIASNIGDIQLKANNILANSTSTNITESFTPKNEFSKDYWEDLFLGFVDEKERPNVKDVKYYSSWDDGSGYSTISFEFDGNNYAICLYNPTSADNHELCTVKYIKDIANDKSSLDNTGNSMYTRDGETMLNVAGKDIPNKQISIQDIIEKADWTAELPTRSDHTYD